VSSDGTMAVFNFTSSELEGIAPAAAQEQYLTKFGFTPPPLSTGFSHTQPNLAESRMMTPSSPGRSSTNLAGTILYDGSFGLSNGTSEVVNKLVAKRKKRAHLSTFGGTNTSASIPSAANPSSASTSATVSNGRSFHEIAGIIPSQTIHSVVNEPSASTTSFTRGAMGESTMRAMDSLYTFHEHADMSTEVTIDALDTQDKGKRKSSAGDFSDDKPSKARTLGGDRIRESVIVRELAPLPMPGNDTLASTSGWPTNHELTGRIPWPALLTYLKVGVEGSEDILEARNSEDGCKY
jgi:protein HIRA/HIR1